MARPPLHVLRHESDGGRWEQCVRAPHPALAGDVHRLVGYREVGPVPLRRRELPSPRVAVIVNLGPPLLAGRAGEAGGLRATPPAFVAPLDDGPAVTEHAGVSEGIQVDFTPQGARRFLGLPMTEVAGMVVDVGDLLGPELLERLADARGWAARLEALERVIAARVVGARPALPDVAWAWQRLEGTGGRASVAGLARELGWSRRHFTARFRAEVGAPPKLAARIIRFGRALERLERGGLPLAELALDCGYYDQAHLDRDFRQFAGLPPTTLLERRLADGFGIAG